MRTPSILLPLLAVFLAAVVGYDGGLLLLPVTPPPGEGDTRGNGRAEPAKAAASALRDATAGPVKKWVDRLRNGTVEELPELFCGNRGALGWAGEHHPDTGSGQGLKESDHRPHHPELTDSELLTIHAKKS